MNFERCANCLLHGWKEVEDKTKLQRCTRCNVIKYCGKDCQREHWLKVHHKHCKYFADPVKTQQWDHKKEDCDICRQSAVVGMAQIKRPNNPNYACIFEGFKEWLSDYLHPHPFPATGDPTDTYEKGIIVLLQLLHKFRLTQPGAISNCEEELSKVITDLAMNRIKIWGTRKISSESLLQSIKLIYIDLSPIDEKLDKSQLIPDPFQLWKIIQLVGKMIFDVDISEKINSLINPLASVPAEFHSAVSEGVNNSAKFLATANQIFDALATRVIPYEHVFSIIRGDTEQKECSFCSREISIADVALGGPFAEIGFIHEPIFCCGSYNCLQKSNSASNDHVRSMAAVMTSVKERESTQCDFCLKLPHRADVHRCSKCLSVMYCSTDCMEKDKDIHKKFCKKDVEERKKKGGGSVRRKEARNALEDMEKEIVEQAKTMTVPGVQGLQEVVGKFRLMNAKKAVNKGLGPKVTFHKTDDGFPSTGDDLQSVDVYSPSSIEVISPSSVEVICMSQDLDSSVSSDRTLMEKKSEVEEKETVKDEGKKKPRKIKVQDSEKDCVKAEDIEGYRGNQDLEDILQFIEGPKSVVPGKKKKKLKKKKSIDVVAASAVTASSTCDTGHMELMEEAVTDQEKKSDTSSSRSSEIVKIESLPHSGATSGDELDITIIKRPESSRSEESSGGVKGHQRNISDQSLPEEPEACYQKVTELEARLELKRPKEAIAGKMSSADVAEQMEKDEIINNLRSENETLSRQAGKQAEVIRKLRSKERDVEAELKMVKAEAEKLKSEIERLNKSLAAKNE